MLPSACSFIIDVSLSYIYMSLFYTTCFGLHGHLHVYDIFIFIFLKESALLVFYFFLHVVTLCTFATVEWVKYEVLLSTPIKMDVCIYIYIYACMSGHNSGTPGAISTKLGTNIAICMCFFFLELLYD
jgi:hypothetical protein